MPPCLTPRPTQVLFWRAFAESSPVDDSPLYTMDGDIVGTPAYMPPEQAEGRLEELGPRWDVYAVGAMLYHLVAGCMPYTQPGQAVNHMAILLRVQDGPPPHLAELAPDCPPELMAICEHAMQRDAQARYANMGELGRDLRAYLERRVVRAYAAGPVAQLRKWVERNRATATAIGLLLMVVTAAGFLLAWKERQRFAEQVDFLAGTHLAGLTGLSLTESSRVLKARSDVLEEAEAYLERVEELRVFAEPYLDTPLEDGELEDLPSSPELSHGTAIARSIGSQWLQSS